MSIARALIPDPKLIVADEPVSMIDASRRMIIINLFKELRDAHGRSFVYITHDLATAYYISDFVAVMNKGRVVEFGAGPVGHVRSAARLHEAACCPRSPRPRRAGGHAHTLNPGPDQSLCRKETPMTTTQNHATLWGRFDLALNGPAGRAIPTWTSR